VTYINPMKKALVVGASGGIGAALMKELETRGFTVTGVSRLKNGLDVTDPVSVDRVFNELSGPFDAVFVATGILAGTNGKPEKTLSALDPSKMLEIYAVNAVGPALILAKVERLLGKVTPLRRTIKLTTRFRRRWPQKTCVMLYSSLAQIKAASSSIIMGTLFHGEPGHFICHQLKTLDQNKLS